jgi:hypothetical protein
LTNPEIQYKAYADYALEMGLITESDRDKISKIYPVCDKAVKLCGTTFLTYFFNDGYRSYFIEPEETVHLENHF